MKACCHYSKGNISDRTEIVRSAGHPWNAWVVCYEGEKEVYSSFSSGLWWEYLSHLAKSPACRREARITLRAVKAALRVIKKEWEAIAR